jgi:SAP domain-containing new25/Domain of unknown function (DUF6434)
MIRPALTNTLSAEAFESWYWLKEELVAFCQQHQIPSAGSKPEVSEKISAFLRNAPPPKTRVTTKKGEMPNEFTLTTVIGEGWKCNPSLGAFFREHCGKGFRFNAAVRNFIHTQVGATLADAMRCYATSVAPGAPKQPIIPQNEYNRFTREFFAGNPGATRAQALAGWWEKRSRKKT